MNDQNAAVTSLFSSIRTALIVFGTVLAGYGFTSKDPLYFWVEAIAGCVCIIGPALWGVYTAAMNVINSRKKVAQAVTAGMNLALSPALLKNADGTPATVTVVSAQQIVKNFAPKAP